MGVRIEGRRRRRRRRKAQVAAVCLCMLAPLYTFFTRTGGFGNAVHLSDRLPLDPKLWKVTEQGELVRVVKLVRNVQKRSKMLTPHQCHQFAIAPLSPCNFALRWLLRSLRYKQDSAAVHRSNCCMNPSRSVFKFCCMHTAYYGRYFSSICLTGTVDIDDELTSEGFSEF